MKSLSTEELPKQNFSRFDIREMGLVFGFEISDMIELIVKTNFCYPQINCLAPINSFVFSKLSATFSHVASILRRRTFPDVVSSIVKSVVVLVVIVRPFCKPHPKGQFSVHSSCSLFSVFNNIAASVKIPAIAFLIFNFTVSFGVPLPLHEPVIINGVNDGKFALRERNPTSTFFHVSSLAGRFVFSTTGLPSST